MTKATPAIPLGPGECTHLSSARLPEPASLRRLWIVVLLTATVMVVEAVGGWISGSLALLADAGHMLTDVGALALALLTMWIGRRPADEAKTYGYRRWEILAALVNGAALFGIAAWVVVEAIQRIGHPPAIRAGLMASIAVVGLATNAIALLLLHRDGQHNLNTRAAYLHILADLLGSVGAVAAAGIIAATGWTLADPILSVALALLILAGAWRLMRESTDVLLEAVPRGLAMADVRRRVLAVPGVAGAHDLHVWTVTSGVVAMSGHVIVPDLRAHPSALEGIRTAMAGLGIGHVTIQLEVEDGCQENLVVHGGGHSHAPGHSHLHSHGHSHHHSH